MNYKRLFLLFFIFYAIYGFISLPQFGVPLDELTQRYIGIQNNRFISGNADIKEVEENKYYGPIFESVSYIFEQLIYNQPLRNKLYMRHTLMFSVFLFAFYYFYLICKRICSKKGAAELSAISFALYPTLFSHAHYNTKDTLFLCLLVFCLYFFVKFRENTKIRTLIFGAIVVGIATTVRFSGIFILFSILVGLMLNFENRLNKRIVHILLYFGIALLAFYAFFPLFWIHPFEGWAKLWLYVTINPWPSEVLCAGVWVQPGFHPWWYLPAWFGVNIPVLVIIFFLFGIFKLIREKGCAMNSFYWVIILVFAVPFFYTIMLHPTLYDGWRHLQFLIVPIFLIAGIGMDKFLEYSYQVFRFWIMVTYFVSVFVISYPLQYNYFNEVYKLAIKPNTFTQDYWCLSTLPCLKWIAANDTANNILISSFTNSPEMQSIWLGYEASKKFSFSEKTGSGQYEIQVRRDKQFQKLAGQEVFVVCTTKDTIARVIKLRQ